MIPKYARYEINRKFPISRVQMKRKPTAANSKGTVIDL